MRALLRMPSTYIAWPLLLACAVTAALFRLPDGYLPGLWLLVVGAVVLIAADFIGRDRLPPWAVLRERDYAHTRDGFLGLAFAGAVLVFCALDLLLFPVALIHDPSAYATMEGGHEHIRRISDLCWTLPVIGVLCTRDRPLRYALIAAGLLFPVLVVDRNRIFAGVAALALVTVFRRDPTRALPWRAIAVLAVVAAAAFSFLGMLRSGSVATVALPFGDAYKAMPAGIQWLMLYVSAGPYNFASLLAKGYRNPDFLMNQLVPLHGSVVTAGTGIPLDASNVNVGTEFLPFLLAWGPLGALAAMLALYLWMRWSIRRIAASRSLFALLIYLRMAYVCLMAPFAPQAFIWMNFGFIGLCLLLQLVSAWLPRRHAAAPSLH
jgi:hypothetical protein